MKLNDYECYDEEIGATKVAENKDEVFSLLKTLPNSKAQKEFLKEINITNIQF